MQKNRYYEDQIISPLRNTSIGGYAKTAFFLVAMLVVLLACGWLVTFEKSVLKRHRRLRTGVFKYLSEGSIGLMCTVRKFEPERGFRLATYAMWWIRVKIQEFILNSWSLVRAGSLATKKKLFWNLRRIKAKLDIYEDHDLNAGPGEELARRLQDRHGHLDARQLLAAVIRDEFPGSPLLLRISRRGWMRSIRGTLRPHYKSGNLLQNRGMPMPKMVWE
ncbi:MAG: sigma factor [Rhodospirillales bacterium]